MKEYEYAGASMKFMDALLDRRREIVIAVKRVVLHIRPHLDEICALWLLRRFGKEQYPGIEHAAIEFWGGNETPDGRSADEWEKEGVLFLGRGGGKFDEHASVTRERKKDECCATLVAKHLGVHQRQELTLILQAVLKEDLNAGGGILGVPYIVKLLHAYDGDNPERVIAWACTALDVLYAEQHHLFTVTAKEFESARIVSCRGPRGRELLISVIESDDESISKYARSKHGGYCAVVIQRRSSGNVQILTNNYYQLILTDAVRIIRMLEQDACGEEIGSWEELEREGSLAGWYYQPQGQMLMNGSLTAPDVEPTRVDLMEIVRAVLLALNTSQFEEDRAEQCRKMICTSTREDPCPWYQWGLMRCRTMRK